MLDGLVGIVRRLLKAVALIIACAFWFVFGFLIWVRVVAFGFIVFAASIMLAPFDRRPNPAPAEHFDQALGLWGRGFERIFRSVRRREDDEIAQAGDPWPEGEPIGCFGLLRNFVWQTLMAGLFWAPLLLTLHFTHVLELPPLTHLQNSAVAWLEGDAPTSPARPAPSPANQAETETPAPPPPCLGLNAIQRVNPPQAYITTRDVNVRAGPGTEHRRLERLQGAQRVSVVGRSPTGQWLLIEIDDELRCYVSADYLRRAE
jgi:hypothetical protein